MKSSVVLGVLALASGALAQTLTPSPTESIGCHSHGDHWHCDGPRVTGVSITASPSSTGTHDHDHDHDEDEHDHDHSEGTGSIAPSPSNSVGCHAHGDHWHCDGPKTAGADNVTTTLSSLSVTPSSIAPVSTGAAATVGLGGSLLMGGLFAAGLGMY